MGICVFFYLCVLVFFLYGVHCDTMIWDYTRVQTNCIEFYIIALLKSCHASVIKDFHC